MESNLAEYICKMLDHNSASDLDVELFKHIFDLINKLMQRRKKLIGINLDDEEMDHFTSGRSDGQDTVVRSTSTLCKEPDEEVASFRRLQKMTGKLFLQLITKLMEIK